MNLPRPPETRRRRHGAWLVCAALSLLPVLRIQATTAVVDPDLSTESTRRAGPFYLRPFFVLKDVGYDDNIRFEAHTREGDATATVGGGLDAVLLAGDRGGVRVVQELNYVSFRDNTDINHWNGFGRARGVLLLRRAALSLEDRYVSIEERPNSEIDERVRRENNAVIAGLATTGQGRLAMKAFLRDERIDYGSSEQSLNDIRLLLNRAETTLSVIGEVRLRPKTTFTLEGAVSRAEFDDPTQARDTRKRALLPGFRFDPSAAVQGDLRAGPLVLTTLDRDDADYRGMIGDGHLSTRLGRSARLKTGFARNVEFSTLGDNLYYVGSQWTTAYEQFFSRRVSGELLYGRGLNHYPKEVPLSGSPDLMVIRDDHLTTRQATVRYRANPQMTIALSAVNVARDSTDDFFDRTRNFFAFGTTYNF